MPFFLMIFSHYLSLYGDRNENLRPMSLLVGSLLLSCHPDHLSACYTGAVTCSKELVNWDEQPLVRCVVQLYPTGQPLYLYVISKAVMADLIVFLLKLVLFSVNRIRCSMMWNPGMSNLEGK